MKKRYNLPCNIAQTLNVIGDRWTMLILRELLTGVTNFNEIKNNLPGLSANILSLRLKSLEKSGLVTSKLYSTHPPRYSYHLTESGKALEPIFNAMIIWASHHIKPCYKEIVDAETGEPVEIGYYSTKTKRRVHKLEIRPIQVKQKAQ